MNDSLQIANYFIKLGQRDGIEITPMKLIKLCYLAHGWYLGLKNEQLIDEAVFAWKYGPVIKKIYSTFKRYKNSNIDEIYNLSDTSGSAVSEYPMPNGEVLEFLDNIWSSYGNFDGITLSKITHIEGSPWYTIYYERGGKDKQDAIIPNNLIKEYYSAKVSTVASEQGS
jgi:uncharacterized phage-associated protein